jgi:hypothetical protein
VGEARVNVAGREVAVSDRPLYFGRSDADDVIGLDSSDRGISAVAGSVERDMGLWWVVNRSRSRQLVIDDGSGGAPTVLDCGHRFAVCVPYLLILVPGEIQTHRIKVRVPEGDLAVVTPERPTSGTLDVSRVRLNERDRQAVAALFGGYVESFPRRQPHPRTYSEAAELLGAPWTALTVRKQIERLKRRFAAAGAYFEGPRANYELAEHLLRLGLLTQLDLGRLSPEGLA